MMRAALLSILLASTSLSPFAASTSATTTSISAGPEQTRWVLASLKGRASKLIASSQPHIQFKEGRFGGFAGCNQIMGAYVLAGEKLSMSSVASTRMYCNNQMTLEQQFVQILEQVHFWRIENAALILLDGRRKAIAVFAKG